MSLFFTNAVSDRVDHGSGAGLDNLPAGAFTLAAWVYRTAADLGRNVAYKGTGAYPNFSWVAVASDGSAGTLRMFQPRGTQDCSFTSNTSALPADEWRFIAWAYDVADTSASQVQMYTGSRTVSVAEAGYTAQQAGIGTSFDESAGNLLIGNADLGGSFASAFPGRIGRVGIFNSKLTLAQLQRLQFAPAWMWAGANTKLLSDYHGTGTQPDYSGNGSAGTVTGATAADHMPLGPPWGFDAPDPQLLTPPPDLHATLGMFDPEMKALCWF